MKAPQKIVNPQQWPHIFAPGEPKLYVDLSLAEFCAGYLVIITQLADKPLRDPIIAHFHELMIVASTYQWSAVSGQILPLQGSTVPRARPSAMGGTVLNILSSPSYLPVFSPKLTTRH